MMTMAEDDEAIKLHVKLGFPAADYASNGSESGWTKSIKHSFL